MLDTTRITIPPDKVSKYLLLDESKAGIFRDSMGFDAEGLDQALRTHLVDNFRNASPSVATDWGMNVNVTGPMTGPTGETWVLKVGWLVEPSGVVRIKTAFPG